MRQDLGLRLPGESGAIERAGHSDFGCRQLIEALQRSVQLIDYCLVGSGRGSSQISVAAPERHVGNLVSILFASLISS